MTEQLDERVGRPGTDWGGAFQRLFLIAILLGIAVTLVVGTQNYDERAVVHFLVWTKEIRLVSLFLLSVGVGILVDEALRLLFRALRGGSGPPPPGRVGREANRP